MRATFAALAGLLTAVLVLGTGAVASAADAPAGAKAVALSARTAPGPLVAAADAHGRKSLDEIRAMEPGVYAAKVLRIINDKRGVRDLPALKVNTCTDKLAESWGGYLSANLLFFHQDLSPFFDNCDARYAGETLARGAVTPRQMVKLWMDSEGHRHILLSKYPNKVGLGAYLDSRGDWLVAADFTQL